MALLKLTVLVSKVALQQQGEALQVMHGCPAIAVVGVVLGGSGGLLLVWLVGVGQGAW